MSVSDVLQLEDVARRFGDLVILEHVDFRLKKGETVALLGPSGSGKSSLLHIAGLLEAPSGGEVYIDGVATSALSDAGRTTIRRNALGFVYQFHHLLHELTALENVSMPLLIRGQSVAEARTEATHILEQVGLGQRLGHKPSQLSGGERQRAAIARALVHRPACVLADEPTGNLDRHTAE